MISSLLGYEGVEGSRPSVKVDGGGLHVPFTPPGKLDVTQPSADSI
jgi:hypothetical protein